MSKIHPIRNGRGKLRMIHRIDARTFIAIVSDPGWDEWAVVEDDAIVAESDAGYGCVESALRDALCWYTLGMIVEETRLERRLVPSVDLLTKYDKDSRPSFPFSEVAWASI